MSAREVQADLVLLGRTPAPAPRPTFVAELEARLASIAADDADRLDVHVDVDIVPTARGRVGLAVAVALAVVLSTAGLAVVSSGDGRDAHTATVETASEFIGGGGSHTSAVDTDDAVTPSGSQPASGLARGSWPSTTVSADGGPSATASSAATGTPIDVLANPATGSKEPVALGLRGSGTPAYSFLEWDRYAGDDFAAYLVLRAAAPDDPAWPDESGRTIMLMRIEQRDTTRYEAQGKVGTTPRFRIVAIDRDGKVIAASGVFQADVGSGLGAPRDPQPPGPPLP